MIDAGPRNQQCQAPEGLPSGAFLRFGAGVRVGEPYGERRAGCSVLGFVSYVSCGLSFCSSTGQLILGSLSAAASHPHLLPAGGEGR